MIQPWKINGSYQKAGLRSNVILKIKKNSYMLKFQNIAVKAFDLLIFSSKAL